MPAFPYANVYLGYLMMYNAGSDQTVDCELAWSADSVVWQRLNPGTPFLPRGPAGSCDSQCIYAPAGPPMAQEGKLLIFYGGSDFPHKGWKRHCLPCLARLRLDGFAGYEPVAPDSRAGVVTQPLLATGEPLRISADARGGMLRVAVLDAPAFATEPSLAITNNVTDGLVQWPGRAFASLKGQRVRLRFELERARLYAFSGLGLP
jgi:hypothetical protein